MYGCPRVTGRPVPREPTSPLEARSSMASTTSWLGVQITTSIPVFSRRSWRTRTPDAAAASTLVVRTWRFVEYAKSMRKAASQNTKTS